MNEPKTHPQPYRLQHDAPITAGEGRVVWFFAQNCGRVRKLVAPEAACMQVAQDGRFVDLDAFEPPKAPFKPGELLAFYVRPHPAAVGELELVALCDVLY